MTDRVDLEAYNSLLNRNRQSEDVIRRIRGRQINAANRRDRAQSDLVSEEWLVSVLNYLDDKYDAVLSNALRSLTANARGKWWARQGYVPDMLQLLNLVDEYYTMYSHVYPNMTPWDAADVLALLRIVFKPWQDRLDRNESLLTLPGNVYRQIYNRTKETNTGFFGFVSDIESRRALLHSAMDAAFEDVTVCTSPVVVWYRSQHKLRSIFGSSLDSQLGDIHVFGKVMNEWLYDLPEVHYYGFLQLSERLRSCSGGRRYASARGGDYEKMDHYVCKYNEISVLNHLLTVVLRGVKPDERELLLARCASNYSIPLVDFDGTVRVGEHAKFSGLFVTNGAEDLISIYNNIMTFVIQCRGAGVDPTRLFAYAKLVVQGDDSGFVSYHHTNREAQYFNDSFPSAFAESAQMLNLVVNESKQEVDDFALTFCKRVYPLWERKGNRIVDGVIYPQYSYARSANQCIHPEDGMVLLTDPALLAIPVYEPYSRELARWAAVMNDSYGDPRWDEFMNILGQKIGWERWARSLLASQISKWDFEDWRARVYRAEKRGNYSQQMIMRHAKIDEV